MADGSLVAARAFAYLALMLAAGLPLYLVTAGRRFPVDPRLRLTMAVAALAGAGASVWSALESVAAMAVLPLAQLDSAMVTSVLSATPLGMVLAIRLGSLTLAAGAAVARLPAWIVAALACAALATTAWTGHAGATEGWPGELHRLADAIHLLAAATWLGALAILLAGLFGKASALEMEHRLAGFANTGTALVIALTITGIANAGFVTGWSIPARNIWSAALLVKLALFAAMLGLAALNRWRLTRHLAEGGAAARRSLRLSLAVETIAALGVIVTVSILGLADPHLEG